VSRLVRDDLAGSAPARSHVFVEVPAPWPADWRAATGYPDTLRSALTWLADQHLVEVRDHLILPERPNPAGLVRFIAYRLPPGPAAGLTRHEYLAPPALLGDLAAAAFAPGGDLEPFASYRSGPGDVRDFFVCTHGSQDACCARLGLPVYRALRRHTGRSGGRLRVWRTSHIGGHRFAPTLVEMPTGRYWGHLDGSLAEVVAGRLAEPSALAGAYRGRALVAPLAQPLERALFLAYGWRWDDTPMEATVEVAGRVYRGGRQPTGPVEEALVTVTYADPAGGRQAQVTAPVVVAGTIPTAGCGKLPGAVPRYRIPPEVSTLRVRNSNPS
jgi:hypothetical protein